MATDSNRFPLHNAIKKILDDPNSRPALPYSVSGDDNFGKASRYGTGVSPDITLNNGNVVVEVHKSENHDRLYYHVGKIDGKTINWGKSHDYDDGMQPSVAITNDGVVVEVHKSQAYDTLWYRVGKVEGETINWGKYEKKQSHKYDDGVQPSVAITNDGLVVEVHKSQNHDRLYYRVGKVDGETINWGKYEKKKSVDYDDGVQPSVAITNDGLVVEVHKSQAYDTLWYRVGKVEGETINWGKYEKKQSHKYDDGVQPSVAITNDGVVVEVHKSQNHDALWYQVGRVNNDTITDLDYGKSKSKKYSNGTVPKVACNGVLAVAAHESLKAPGREREEPSLFYSILTLPIFSGCASSPPHDKNVRTYKVTFMPYIGDLKAWRSYNPSTIDGVGILVGLIDGQLVGAQLKSQTCEYLKPGAYTWVYISDGYAIIYKYWDKEAPKSEYTRHSQLGSGKPVICAGEFEVIRKNNLSGISTVIGMVNDASGHYKPDGGACLKYLGQKLQSLDIPTDTVQWYWHD